MGKKARHTGHARNSAASTAIDPIRMACSRAAAGTDVIRSPSEASFRGCHPGRTEGAGTPRIRGALPLSSDFVPVLQCGTRVTGASPPVARRQKSEQGGHRMVRGFMLGAATALALAAATPAHAVVELQWWHAMTGANNDVIVKLANEFNAAQSEYKVSPSYKGSYPDTMNAGIAAFRAGNAPHIMQVFEVGTATMMAATGAVKPVHVLMKEAGETFDSGAYLSAITGYYSTSTGEMLSFPFNSSSTVRWMKKDAFKKAGIDADKAPKTWPEVFDAAKKLKAAGYANCGFGNAWVTWVNLEQLSAWHNIPLASKANGMDGWDTEMKFNTPLHIKHL